MKRMLSMLLIFALLFSLAVPSFAEVLLQEPESVEDGSLQEAPLEEPFLSVQENDTIVPSQHVSRKGVDLEEGELKLYTPYEGAGYKFAYRETSDSTVELLWPITTSEAVWTKIPDTIDGKAVTSIADDFCSASGSELKGPLHIPETVTYIGDYAFYNNSELTGEIRLPEGLTHLGNYAFSKCSRLTGGIYIPESLNYVPNYAFNQCEGLNGTLHLSKEMLSIGDYAFSECYGLRGELELPQKLGYIGKYAFAGCSKLTGTIQIPETILSWGKWAFYLCKGLTGVILPRNSLPTIPEGMFFACTGMKGDLHLPDKIWGLEERCFYGCNFTNVYAHCRQQGGANKDMDFFSVNEEGNLPNIYCYKDSCLDKYVQLYNDYYGPKNQPIFNLFLLDGQPVPPLPNPIDKGQLRAFVTRLYDKCLDRVPDNEGIETWVRVLSDSTWTAERVAWGFVFSKEYMNKHTSNDAYIRMLYQVYMDREADPSGYITWSNLLNSGEWNREQIMQGFSRSMEFKNICARYGMTPW